MKFPAYLFSLILATTIYSCAAVKKDTAAPDHFNYVIGTQSFGPSYKFSNETYLVESARRIREMGSNILKISIDPSSYKIPSKALAPVDVLKEDSSFKAVLNMDFSYYMLWVYNTADSLVWRDGMSQAEKDREYKTIFDVSSYLLETFKNSGKTFYLGHWEGDWHLLNDYNFDQEKVDSARIAGMIDWLNIRQKAVDDAKKKIAAANVQLYHYTEVNRPLFALTKGFPRMVNKVLPNIDVDYISYSSYDVVDTASTYEILNPMLTEVLNYIESNLKPRPAIKGKRVWIGEYGFPAATFTPQEQDRRSRNVMRVALEWGCPFVLYWEMYNNEVKNGKQVGYWMIDDNNVKQPVYNTHLNFYDSIKKWRNSFIEKNKVEPSHEAFVKEAVNILK